MGDHSHGSPNTSGTVATAGQDGEEKFRNPGLPPHRPRLADTNPQAEKRAEKQVAALFVISIIGTLVFFIGYFGIKLEGGHTIADIRVQNLLLGLGTAFAMLGIGVAEKSGVLSAATVISVLITAASDICDATVRFQISSYSLFS